MYKTSKIICITFVIVFIISCFLSPLNKLFIIPIIFCLVFTPLFFYLLVFLRGRERTKSYSDVIVLFDKLLEENKFNECEKLLNKNEYLVSTYYYHQHTTLDIGKPFDGYKGYSTNYRLRNKSYFKLYLKTKQYQKGLDLYNKLPKTIKQEHIEDIYLFEKHLNN